MPCVFLDRRPIITRWVNLLIDQHGADAPIHAAMKADAILETGDMDG